MIRREFKCSGGNLGSRRKYFNFTLLYLLCKSLIYVPFFQEIMMIRREFKCCAGCCWCIGCCNSCSLEIYIESPPGNVIGSVKQQ